jgi:putative peptide zinc metalloprotease protein
MTVLGNDERERSPHARRHNRKGGGRLERTLAYDTGNLPVPGPGGFAVACQDLTEEPPSAPPQSGAGAGAVVPRLSAGLRLHGEYQGSGFNEPKYIARRGDGQVVQLSRLLHLVADAIDGIRDIETISYRVSGRFGRELSTENIAYLIENKLEPLGVSVPFGQEDDRVDGPRSDLLLALKGHRVLFNERRVARIARSLAWLHRPLAVAAVLLSAVALDVWLFGFFGAMDPVLQVIDQPVLLLVVFGLTVASLAFHEFGHASACTYGGAKPGCIGCGLFLIWPSMYTDVTDVYRIGRGGRIRTDLGGIYFNVVFMLGLAAGYFLTGQEFFLAAVYIAHFEVLEQLMPAVRLDGYYILGDLAGVPDLFGKIKPILLSMIPGRPVRPEVADLRRSARVIVTVWVLTMVPLLLGELGYALWNLPRIITTGIRSLTEQLTGTWSAFADGQIAAGLAGTVGSVMLVFPLAGMIYLSIRLGGRLIRTAVRSTNGKPRLRVALCALALAGMSGLSYAWVSGVTPKPLPPRPPIAPILQPGVSAAPDPARDADSPAPSASASPTSTLVTGPGAAVPPPGLSPSPGASVSGSPAASASASPAGSKPPAAASSPAATQPPVAPSSPAASGPAPASSAATSEPPASPSTDPSASASTVAPDPAAT